MMISTEMIKDLVVKRTNANDIRRVALKEGMRTLRQDGW